MFAAASGKSNIGIPKSVGQEFTKDVPKGLPEKLGGRDKAAHAHAHQKHT